MDNFLFHKDQAKRKGVVKMVSRLFQVEGRHQGTALIFIGQNIFDGDDIKEIRRQSDYLVLFRCVSGENFIYYEFRLNIYFRLFIYFNSLTIYDWGSYTFEHLFRCNS